MAGVDQHVHEGDAQPLGIAPRQVFQRVLRRAGVDVRFLVERRCANIEAADAIADRVSGGTITDAVAIDPRGRVSRTKVLSSSALE